MKVIRGWTDLREHGIVLLTGEACSLTYRVLFDLTEGGKRVVERCLSVTIESEPWNSGEEHDPHVASVMLTRAMLEPLAVFALLETNCVEVRVYEDMIIGFKAGEHRPAAPDAKRTFRYGPDGDRNRHQFSGRLV